MKSKIKHRQPKAPWTCAFPEQVDTRVKDHIANEKRLYKIEARAYVRAARKRGQTCPVVAAVPELRNGKCYGHPMSNRIAEVHHTRGRGCPGSPLLRDQRLWMAVSKAGHRWIHSHIEQSRKMLFICERGQWNEPLVSFEELAAQKAWWHE
jgi:hypothetical protein